MLAAVEYGDDVALNSLAVNSHALNTLANVIWIRNLNVISCTTELT